jgi:hypothetical protein
MLEVARRQGLIASSFQDGPNEEKLRLYHSWDYEATDWTIDPSTPIVSDTTPIVNEDERDSSPIVSGEGSDESSNEATSAPEEPFVAVLDDKKEPDVVAVEDKEDYLQLLLGKSGCFIMKPVALFSWQSFGTRSLSLLSRKSRKPLFRRQWTKQREN